VVRTSFWTDGGRVEDGYLGRPVPIVLCALARQIDLYPIPGSCCFNVEGADYRLFTGPRVEGHEGTFAVIHARFPE
jgi:hypothetical protein